MKIAIYSAKGGAGKTPIATNICLDRGYAIATNERFNVFESMEAIDEDMLLVVDMEDRFPDVGDSIDIVFDLAGSISKSSHSIASAIEFADLVIVPIENEYKSINSGVNTLLEIRALKKPILVVATKLDKKKNEIFGENWTLSADFINVQKVVHETVGRDIPVMPLKRSKAFDLIFDNELSIRELMEVQALFRFQQKTVFNQFEEIYQMIDSITNQQTSNERHNETETETE